MNDEKADGESHPRPGDQDGENNNESGKWQVFWKPFWNGTDDVSDTPISRARLYLAKKILDMLTKFINCKQIQRAFNDELKLWTPEMKLIVPAHLHDYIPTSFDHALRMIAPVTMKGYQRDVCSKDNNVFQGTEHLCRICRGPRFANGKPVKTITYYSIEEFVRILMSLPGYAEAMKIQNVIAQLESDRYMDIVHGQLFNEALEKVGDAEYIIPLIMHGDSITIHEHPQASVTPILGVNALLPRSIRWKFTAVLMLALFPRCTKDIQPLCDPIIEEITKLSTGFSCEVNVNSSLVEVQLFYCSIIFVLFSF